MDLQTLKNNILNKSLSDDLIIFMSKNNDVIVNDYIKGISKLKNLDIQYLDDLDGVIQDNSSIFFSDALELEPRLRVYKTNEFIYSNLSILNVGNVIVCAEKISDETLKLFKNYVVDIPKLEQWHINAYAYKLAEGSDKSDIDSVLKICENNLSRMYQELSKLENFSISERKFLLNQMLSDGIFNDLSNYSIFNFTNAVMKKDLKTLNSIYLDISNIDINEFGLVTTLLKNFRNLIAVQLNSNPTVANTGLTDKQLYAIRKLPRVFSQKSLTDIYIFLSDIDSRIKMGDLPVDIVIDYVTMKILTL